MSRHPAPPADPLPWQVVLHEPLELGEPTGWEIVRHFLADLPREWLAYHREQPCIGWCATAVWVLALGMLGFWVGMITGRI